VSHIWQIQHRLFVEQLGAIEAEPTQEQLVRLASATRVLLFQHQVDQGGYCRMCIKSRWWRLPRSICTIYAAFTRTSVEHSRPGRGEPPNSFGAATV
jgi:hypothetical protein